MTSDVLYLFPDRRRWKRECPECVGSLIMLAVLPRQREVWTESMDGRLVCVMDWATFTTFCSFLWSWAEQEPYQAVIQPERMLFMVHLCKLEEHRGSGALGAGEG